MRRPRIAKASLEAQFGVGLVSGFPEKNATAMRVAAGRAVENRRFTLIDPGPGLPDASMSEIAIFRQQPTNDGGTISPALEGQSMLRAAAFTLFCMTSGLGIQLRLDALVSR
jgi:hypothetical protein